MSPNHNDEHDDDLADEIEQLKASYASQLPQKTAELSQALDKALAALTGGTTPEWRTIELGAHKLAGSSGTYGFSHLSALLRHLEELVADLTFVTSARSAQADYLRRWTALFDEQSRLAAARTEPEIAVDDLIATLKRTATPRKRKAA